MNLSKVLERHGRIGSSKPSGDVDFNQIKKTDCSIASDRWIVAPEYARSAVTIFGRPEPRANASGMETSESRRF